MKTTSNTNDPSRDNAMMRELLLSADRQEIEPPCDAPRSRAGQAAREHGAIALARSPTGDGQMD